MREANVDSQSADTIKLDFSSCSGRKQNVSADLSSRAPLLPSQPPGMRHQPCAHCPSVLLVRFSATPRMMEIAVSLNRELGIPNTEKLFNGRPPTAALDSRHDAPASFFSDSAKYSFRRFLHQYAPGQRPLRFLVLIGRSGDPFATRPPIRPRSGGERLPARTRKVRAGRRAFGRNSALAI